MRLGNLSLAGGGWTQLGDVAVFEKSSARNCPLLNKVTKVDVKNYSSALFIGWKLKQNSEQKAENIFVAPPYCQTECVRSLYSQ
ncbi:MAG: hypothetical protein ABIU30_18995 [Ferruginibacter sp.]